MEITLKLTESHNSWIVRDSITINTDEYAELEGKTLDEIKEYIKENAYEMKAPSNVDYCDNLRDYLEQQDVIREKILDEDSEIHFD